MFRNLFSIRELVAIFALSHHLQFYIMRCRPYILLFVLALIAYPVSLKAQYAMDYSFSMVGNTGSGDFAPHYLSANRHGLVTHAHSGYLRASLFRGIEHNKRFSYEFGADLVGLLSSTSPVTSYITGTPQMFRPGVSRFSIHQLYGGVKYRKVFLWAGARELTDKIVNFELSSGGMVWSGNARPIPQVSAGFIDFVDFPGTKRWLQIKGEISYGKFIDDNYLREHYNYYNSYITTDAWYHNKSIYFRSHPDKPLVVTIGAEQATQFGGTRTYYNKGVITGTPDVSPTDFLDFCRVLIPLPGGKSANKGDQMYVYGNTVGQLNASVKYTFKDRSSVKGYFEWIFDDGSGMGKQNAWDGLWGLEYNSGGKDLLSGLVLEYVDMKHQSGAVIWDPNYYNDSQMALQGIGRDNYYNNYFYNAWAHFGQSNGTPMAKAPLYNTDGYLKYKHNRIRAVHLGATGYISPELKYRLLASYRVSWGTYDMPTPVPLYDTSGMIECIYSPSKLSGWNFTLSLAGDTGTLYGDTWGVSIGIRKNGIWRVGKK